MKRLKLLNMCSRETNRLPVAQIAELIQSDRDLPVELGKSPSEIPVTDKYVVYHLNESDMDVLGLEPEIDGYQYRFILAEKDGVHERLLDVGTADSIRYHCGEGNRYVDFRVVGEKLGRFALYCEFFPVW